MSSGGRNVSIKIVDVAEVMVQARLAGVGRMPVGD
jgi:hypothetical protein